LRHDFLDRWSRIDSPLHRLPASLKLAAALLLVLAIVATPMGQAPALAAIATFLVTLAALSRVPPRYLIGRLLLLEPLALGGALLAAFQPDGWARLLAILTRSTLCLATMLLLTSTTPFAELLAVLRRLRLPALLVTVLALLYRYLFVLVDEAERLQRARRARSFDRGRPRSWLLLAGLLGQLFARSTERAERIYAAMGARGWR
jgi:cobalt/nickel transport system permease protein